jgi:hypothetical protein
MKTNKVIRILIKKRTINYRRKSIKSKSKMLLTLRNFWKTLSKWSTKNKCKNEMMTTFSLQMNSNKCSLKLAKRAIAILKVSGTSRNLQIQMKMMKKRQVLNYLQNTWVKK